MDIVNKFIQLTKRTEILGYEDALRKHLPNGIQKDEVGNYWIKIGKSDTLFTSHLDTAAIEVKDVVHVYDSIKTKSGRKEHFVETDGSTLLGADDRAGVVVMLYMIEHKVPGLYYFFIGEESGTVGSSNILALRPDIFEPYKKCISFDRRGYGSVISYQLGGRCCSNDFVNAISNELTTATGYKWSGDDTGIYTDSAVFMDVIPECTNLSVGYFNEHTTNEFQNLTYLIDLCEGVIKVDWENLPVKRDPGPMDTPNPKRKHKKKSDLSDQELHWIFMVIEDIFEETQQKECVNSDNFIPEKEMLFVSLYDQTQIVSVWVHEDGSITIGKDKFKNIEELEDTIEAVYGYRYDWGKSTTDYEDEDEDEDDIPWGNDKDKINTLSGVDFENNIDVDSFLYDVSNFNLTEIQPLKMNKLLDKYNKNIESLIMWIYERGNDPNKTMGLTWDDEKNIFIYNDAS